MSNPQDPATYDLGCAESTGGMNAPDIVTIANTPTIEKKGPKTKGMLVVTAFRSEDLPLLEKRIKWVKHLNLQTTNELLLVADANVTEYESKMVAEWHKPFFSEVHLQSIIDPSPAMWPENVNFVFQTVVRMFQGYYGQSMSWDPYLCWFYFEPDV